MSVKRAPQSFSLDTVMTNPHGPLVSNAPARMPALLRLLIELEWALFRAHSVIDDHDQHPPDQPPHAGMSDPVVRHHGRDVTRHVTCGDRLPKQAPSLLHCLDPRRAHQAGGRCISQISRANQMPRARARSASQRM